MGIFDGQRFFIYGNGLSGRAARTAITKAGGKAVVCADCDGEFAPPPDGKYTAAVISPGVPFGHEVYKYCSERSIEVMSEPDIGFALAGDRKKICVTGTNGKTTTVRLIADMLGGVACGNIGYPLSAAALEGSAPLVCELSSFQLAISHLAPDIAVITNIDEDHIDRHGSREAYARCKCNIARNMESGYLVLGEDITVGALATLKTGAQPVWCRTTGPCDGCYVYEGNFWFCGDKLWSVDCLRLAGEHNLKNALAAIAASLLAGGARDEILRALSTAKADPHRNEYVGTAAGKRWIDDSKGTNVSACRAAIELTAGTVCLIVGGRSKCADFRALFDDLDGRVVEIVAMGECAQTVRDIAVDMGAKVKLSVVDGLADAVARAAESDADTVLLSPACASFDEFSDYAERGRSFAAAVRALEKEGKRQ